MSFLCVFGMNEVGWEDGVYYSNGMILKFVGCISGGLKMNNGGFEIVGSKLNGEVVSYFF